MTNREKALVAITNLATALEACGIETAVENDEETLGLCAYLWNCKDGSTDRLEVWANATSDFEIESCSNPLSTVDEFINSL